MFNFFNMMDNYEARKIGLFKTETLKVSTVKITDSSKYQYETAVSHPDYNNDLIIVETYQTDKEAQAGHERWVHTMTSENLPEVIRDVSGLAITDLKDMVEGNSWRNYKRNTSIS